MIAEQDLPLQRLFHWERVRADDTYLTQPLAGGELRNFTWAQTLDEARRMAAHLKSFNWEPGSRVAILAKNSAWWFLAEYAIWMAGHTSVPIYPSLTGESVKYILEHSQAKGIFIGQLDSSDWTSMRQGIPANLHAVRLPLANIGEIPGVELMEWGQIMATTAPLAGQPVRAADDLAIIVYTSGTTGTPKGVMHSFGIMAAAIKTILQVYGCGPEDRLVSYLPLAHIADRICSQATSIGAGCRVFFMEGGLETFAADIRRARPTFFCSVPRLWTKFRQGVLTKLPQEQLSAALADPQQGPVVRQQILAQLGFDACRIAVVGAAPLPPELHQWYLDLGLNLCEVYGMSENFAICHVSVPGHSKHGYVGRPMPGVQAKLSDTGELLMRGPGIMLGYYKDPEKTSETFTEDGYLRTGDVGEIDDEDYFKITGRAKELFKTSKGKYVAPAPIENLLAAHGQVEACCVTGVGFPQPFALVMLSPGEHDRRGSGHSRAELAQSFETHLQAINGKLPPHEQLDFLVVVAEQWTVENGFSTPTFKIKRNVIEKHYGEQFEGWASQRKTVVWL